MGGGGGVVAIETGLAGNPVLTSWCQGEGEGEGGRRSTPRSTCSLLLWQRWNSLHSSYLLTPYTLHLLPLSPPCASLCSCHVNLARPLHPSHAANRCNKSQTLSGRCHRFQMLKCDWSNYHIDTLFECLTSDPQMADFLLYVAFSASMYRQQLENNRLSATTR